jgi:hypothetical protein
MVLLLPTRGVVGPCQIAVRAKKSAAVLAMLFALLVIPCHSIEDWSGIRADMPTAVTDMFASVGGRCHHCPFDKHRVSWWRVCPNHLCTNLTGTEDHAWG